MANRRGRNRNPETKPTPSRRRISDRNLEISIFHFRRRLHVQNDVLAYGVFSKTLLWEGFVFLQTLLWRELNLHQKVHILKSQIGREILGIRRRYTHFCEGGYHTVLKKCLQFFFSTFFHVKTPFPKWRFFSFSRFHMLKICESECVPRFACFVPLPAFRFRISFANFPRE